MMKMKHTSRKRFTKWLKETVDSQEVDGVYWLDKEKTTFRVPWTRVDSPDFDLAQDAMLFQKWAEFTGRYRVGERTDPSVWKTRFRCAIRKMPEIVEVKMQNNLDDTNGQQPFRVFRFKSEGEIQPPKKEPKRKPKKPPHSRGVVTRQHMTTHVLQIKQDVVLTGNKDFAALDFPHIDSTKFGQPDDAPQKKMPWPTPSMRDYTQFNNTFEMGVTQCEAGNTSYGSNEMTATFFNTPWSNQTGIDKGNAIQGACEADLLNLSRISLQEITSILQHDEPTLVPQGGDLVPWTHGPCTPYSALQSSFEDGRGIKSNCYNSQMFEDYQGSQEAKAYNNSIILNDLTEIIQQPAAGLSNCSGQEGMEIPNREDCMLQTLNNEYPAQGYQSMIARVNLNKSSDQGYCFL